MTPGRDILDRIQEAYRNGNYTEDLFAESVCHVLESNNVEYETEHPIKSDGPDDKYRRCDIYIPSTDTAIELKISANLRGIGQCVYYSRFCREAILLADGDPLEEGHETVVRQAAEITSGVKYGLCIPGGHKSPPVMQILTNDKAEFFYQAAYGDVGDRDFLTINQLGHPNQYSGIGTGSGKNAVNTRRKHEEKNGGDWF